AADEKLRLSKNVRSPGPARSSGAILLMRVGLVMADGRVAPVRTTTSSSVSPGDFRRKIGSLILVEPVWCHEVPPRSELGAAAEPEKLRVVADLAAAAG